MSSMYTQTLGQHSWTKLMDTVATICGECPVCMAVGKHTHTEFSGGDGERGYVEYECEDCGAHWTDAYNLVTRTVYPADTPEQAREPAQQRSCQGCGWPIDTTVLQWYCRICDPSGKREEVRAEAELFEAHGII
jgi:hypothetical protein